MDIDQLSVNTIRTLSIDAVQKANSGHPGMPLGCAPLVYHLFTKVMKHNPANPNWINRDRFVLSAGHASMLLYSILHLTGYDISLDDIKNFRQLESRTPGHPEYKRTPGVEVTSGPLGQGFAMAVGMAVAQKYINATAFKYGHQLLDHKIFVLCSDGDLMEGISYEAASFAGHHKLNNLIVFYDDNGISIEGETSLTFSDNVQARFQAQNWTVRTISDVNNLESIEAMFATLKDMRKPTLVITKSNIGFGSPNKQGTSAAHGSPLGAEEVKLTKKNLGWDFDEDFFVPPAVKAHFGWMRTEFAKYESEWNALFERFREGFPEDAETFEKIVDGDFGMEWKKALPRFQNDGKKIATRVISGQVLNAIADSLPTLIGGSADLSPSNNTSLAKYPSFSSSDYSGRNIHFGIREHSMGGILNGMAIYGGVIPYGGTFLVFSDYMRPAIRLAAMMRLKVIYIFTHDSIGLGEDGPTHQPVEQAAALRAIPNLVVLRPADASETVAAWRFAIKHQGGPVALLLTRQGVPFIEEIAKKAEREIPRGAYPVIEPEGTPEIILMASGSELSLIVNAAKKLAEDGIRAKVVSFVSFELFEYQSAKYQKALLPPDVEKRLAVEAGVSFGWDKYTGLKGKVISIERFGESAPDSVLFEKFGYTVDNIYNEAKALLHK
ncbi:MAG: transketolase [Ignavibacteriaceae bacterium]